MTPDDFRFEIRNAPTIESDSGLKEQLRLQILEFQRLNRLLESQLMKVWN